MSIPLERVLDVAVTSWLVPGVVSHNAAFLASRPSLEEGGCRIVEMGICCFDSEASFACRKEDWPDSSAPFGFHVHLPLDLPWHDETQAPCALAGKRAVALMKLLRELDVRRGVLHPPSGAGTELALRRLEGFLAVWQEAGYLARDLLLENDRGLEWPVWEQIASSGVTGICLDAAHLLTYAHDRLLEMLPSDRVRLVHWSAPGTVPGKDLHHSLVELSPSQKQTARDIVALFPDALPLVEVFSWEGTLDSMPVLRELYLS